MTIVEEKEREKERAGCAPLRACNRLRKSACERKFFYLFTCEYCFSHYVTIAFLALTGYKLLLDDWRGYIISFFAVVMVANAYLNLYARLRVEGAAQRQLLVVVERDDELLPLREPGDRLAERLPHLRLRERRLRLGALRVLDCVDQGDLVAAGRHRPELVERGDRGAGDLRQARAELVLGQAELRRDLLVGRRAVQLLLQLGDRPLDVARARAVARRRLARLSRVAAVAGSA